MNNILFSIKKLNNPLNFHHLYELNLEKLQTSVKTNSHNFKRLVSKWQLSIALS